MAALAHAAGAVVDQQGLARLEVQRVQGALGGAAGQRKRCGLFPGQGGRLVRNRGGGKHHVLGERAEVHAVASAVGVDLVAHLELGGVEADGFDDAGNVPSRDDGEGDVHDRIEVTAHDLPVHRVHARGLDADQHAAGPYLGAGKLELFQLVETSVARVGHGFHRLFTHRGDLFRWWKFLGGAAPASFVPTSTEPKLFANEPYSTASR